MAKKPKTPVAPPSDQIVTAASKTPEIANLLRLARVFARLGVRDDFTLDIPLFCSMFVTGKGFRRGNVPLNTRMRPELVMIGKREGLIFRFTPVTEVKRNTEAVEYIEVTWADIVNTMPALHAEMIDLLGDKDFVGVLDEKIKKVISANASMHSILTKGFTKAQEDEREAVDQETIEDNPLFGAFG